MLARLGCRRRGGHTTSRVLPAPEAGARALGSSPWDPLPECPRLGVSPQDCRSQSYTRGRVAAQSGPWARPSCSHHCLWGSPERGTDFPRGPGLLEAVWGQARPASPCPSASGWAGEDRSGVAGWPLCPPPCTVQLLPPLWALGLRLCRAELGRSSGSWRGKCRAALPSTKPHCSQQILPGSGCIFFK